MDSDAEFIFVPREKVMEVAKDKSAIPFDVEGAELMHYVDHGEKRVSFDSIIRKYNLIDYIYRHADEIHFLVYEHLMSLVHKIDDMVPTAAERLFPATKAVSMPARAMVVR